MHFTLIGAIATKYLSNQNAKTVGIIGAGIQARLQLQAIMLVRKINKITVWARDKIKANQFLDSFKDLEIDLNMASSCKELASLSEIIVTTTPSKKPLLRCKPCLRPAVSLACVQRSMHVCQSRPD